MAKTYGERWEIVKNIGEGGQAHIFLVTDIKGNGSTKYVLKRLKNLERLNRFKREIEAVRNLHHPNIVQLIDFDVDEPEPYLVTEYCSGGSLDAAEPFWNKSPIIALELFQQICEGVAFAHANNIIHRDLKPSNIYLRNAAGPAVVGDFGICYLEDNGERLTLTDEAVGPRIFMAPELEGGRITQIPKKCDTYSLGKLLYWLLSKGTMLPRERYREREFDLRGFNREGRMGWSNIYLEHVNRLLDLMIIEDPEKRRSVDNILLLCREATRLIRKEYTPTGKDLPQPCIYCGQGSYRDTPVASFYSGLHITDVEHLRIVVCDYCGHVQFFRTGERYNQEWWKS